MFRIRLLAALSGALFAGLTVATIAAAHQIGDDTSSRPGDYAIGGGRFGPGCFEPVPNPPLCFARPRDFSVDAHAKGNGKARGIWFYGNNDTGFSLTGRVTCLNREGNMAVVGGVITESPDPGSVGLGFVQYYVDNGPVGGAVRDLSSAANLDPLDASTWPAGFPSVCPSPPTSPAGYLPVHSGDVDVDSRTRGG
jgi:hypothetical protein